MHDCTQEPTEKKNRIQELIFYTQVDSRIGFGPARKLPRLAYRKSGRRELSLPSSHTTVRTGPYTAVHDYCDLASTIFFIGIYPIASMTPFDMALCMP